jgi:putative ABC transport system permease protein
MSYQISNFLTTPVSLGLMWLIFALGVYIAFRILDIPDMSAEGVFPLGAILVIYFINFGWNSSLSTILIFFIGALVGLVNALMIVYLKIPGLLSGIIVMTGLYSILVIVSHGNIALTNGTKTIFDNFAGYLKGFIGNRWGNFVSSTVILTLIALLTIFVIYWFFGTDLGLAIRASGKNKAMSRAQGINNDVMTIIALMFSSALIALCGALIGQYQENASATTGRGSIVIGLAIVFLGEALFGKKMSFKIGLLSLVVGSFLYWYIIQAILLIPNFNTNLLYLMQAILITIFMIVPMVKDEAISLYRKFKER